MTTVQRRAAETPAVVDIDGVRNVTDLLQRRLDAAPDHVAFEVREPGTPLDAPWVPVTTAEFAEQVGRVAKGLIASGVQAGDAVLIMAPTQYLWAVADLAAATAGAVVVPVYDTAAHSQLTAVLADARPVAAFVGDAVLDARLRGAAAEAGVELRTWALRTTGDAPAEAHPQADPAEQAALLSHLIERGESISGAQLEERRTIASLDDIATIVYTSGTTGDPKGAQITHRNLVGQVLNTAEAYTEVVHDRGNTILFLPLTHVLGRALQLICIANGMRVAHLADPKEVVQALSVLRPTFLVVVPRVLEKIQAAAAKAAREKRLAPVWRAAVRTAESWGEAMEAQDRDAHARPGLRLRARRAVFDRIFFGRLRALMGGRIDYLLSGAATLRPELAQFFRGIGVPIIEGYGLTETTAPLTGGRPGSLVAGSVGTPLPGNEVRISAEGEVLARGVGVFAGYRNPGHTAAAFVDGFFRTGDLGELGSDGALTLRGRMGQTIVTSTGRTVSPERWERAVEMHPLVAHAVLVGTDRPYLTGLIVLDTEAVQAWCDEHGHQRPAQLADAGLAAVADDRLRAEIAEAIEPANAAVSPGERVQTWSLLAIGEDRAPELITPTMKLKRSALLAAAAPVIDALYA
ncbi:AMP-dependent synthetase/ligase [Leucobacter japonicus]|uniref:AMP-dependent synthetase/ligase n=1 Tax=Leucobacter japonicus TaxID=1461259 RepID=UPI0006A7F0BD|nr:AMP-binding protein [Leucobacter japonicus]